MTETKKCPLCAETIPDASAACEYCGAQFKVSSRGYCTNCHALRDADETGHCRVCANAVTDWRVESQLIETPTTPPPPVVVVPTPAIPLPPKKKGWVWWVVGGAMGLFLLAAVVVVILLFNAGALHLPASVPAATSTPEATVTEPPPTATSTPVVLTGTLTLWHSFSPGGSEENALLAVIQNAETENPGLDVIATYHSSENNFILDEYTATVSDGGGPDILLAWNEKVGDMVRAGTVLDLQAYATEDRLAGIKQYALAGLTIDGKLYGLPETSNIVALYYNKALLPTPPATTDDMLSLIKAGKKLGIFSYPPYWLYGFWSGFGVQIQDENGRCNAGQSGFVPAVQYILDLQKAGDVQTEYEEAQNRFINGQTSMLINGSWALADYKDALGADLGVAVLPGGPAGPSRPITGVSGFFINPKSDKSEVAFLLILHMTSQASAQIFTDQAGHIPVRADVIISDPLLYNFSVAASQGTPRAENKLFDNYWEPFDQMFNDTFSGAVTPQVAIQRACDAMNSLNGLP